jgi:hypothetical protein
MLFTMVLCFALTISVAVSIGLAAIVGIQVQRQHAGRGQGDVLRDRQVPAGGGARSSSWPAT